MKKNYLIMCTALLSLAATAQTDHLNIVKGEVRPITHNSNPASGSRAAMDTTGIGFNVITNLTFLPEFAGSGQVVNYSLGTGYVFGNNPYAINVCAQGYENLTPTPVNVVGAIVWFSTKRSSGTSSATSKVIVKAWAMAPNKGYNTTGTAGSSAFNSPGPATAPTAPVRSADLLFSDIDTTFLADNYVEFATPATFTGNFAVGVDSKSGATGLFAGDTVGILADDAGDAANLDYAFLFYANKWYVSDNLFSASGSGDADNNIAIFAVFADATGVNEYFNGMKLTAYPNPSINNTTVEYTLEKNASNVKIVVLDAKGAKIVENNYSAQAAGTYKMNVETNNLAAGTYFYQLTVNGHNFTKKLVVAK